MSLRGGLTSRSTRRSRDARVGRVARCTLRVLAECPTRNVQDIRGRTMSASNQPPKNPKLYKSESAMRNALQ